LRIRIRSSDIFTIDPGLSSTARSFIETTLANGDQIAISSITLVEIVYLIERGRIPTESLSSLATELNNSASGLVEISVNLSVVRALTNVDALKVPDMPDRIVAATALFLGVPVISRDRKIQLSGITTIW
jgi:PIN domain nuclease of toxin-antitoxin system